MTKSADAGDFINIFTFNYTRVQMRGYELKEIPVHYMHGRCEDGKIIVGTRDDLQMDPSYDFLLKSMDDSFTPPDIVAALKDADEVIIFGHSLGENDRQYFAPFFLKQADYDNPERKDITIFTRDDNSKIEIKRALQKMTDGKCDGGYREVTQKERLMIGKYPVITLCGSTRFKEQFLEAQKRLTLAGNIVISVGLFGHSGDDEVWTEGTKEMLDDMHKRKIDMADGIIRSLGSNSI